MAVPLTNLTLRDIANEVEFTSGTTFSNPLSFETIRNAADFAGFNPTYLDGATILSDIKSFGQFRGYPSGSDYKTAILEFYLPSSNTSGTYWDIRVAVYDVKTGVDVLLGTIQWKFESPGTSTVSCYPSGYNGTTAAVMYHDLSLTPSSPFPVSGSLFISKARTASLANTSKIKLQISDASGLTPSFTKLQYADQDTKQATWTILPIGDLDTSSGTGITYSKSISTTSININL